MQRYRANVDHAFRMAAELSARVQHGTPVGAALELAERLMKEQQGSTGEKERLVRVRRKRRLWVEGEKVGEVAGWGPAVPPRSEAKKDDKAGQRSFVPSQNQHASTPVSGLIPPKTPTAVQSYLSALRAYLKGSWDAGVGPKEVELKQVKARIARFTEQSFTLEVQVTPLVKAFIDASPKYASDELDADLVSIDLAGLVVGGINEDITSTTTPSKFPNFRSLSADILTQTTRALPTSTKAGDVWTAYMPITEAIARLVLAAAQFQSQS